MGTTTKMAIPYPEATGLVKDGWEDMKDIATQVDSKSGLILLNTTSFSAVASQSVNNVFNASFENYRIILALKGSVSGEALRFRVRASGTDLTSSTYIIGRYYVGSRNAVTASSLNNNTSTGAFIGDYTTNIGLITVDISNPFATEATSYFSASTDNILNISGGVVNNSLSYDGITIYAGSGTITGSFSIFGYNK